MSDCVTHHYCECTAKRITELEQALREAQAGVDEWAEAARERLDEIKLGNFKLDQAQQEVARLRKLLEAFGIEECGCHPGTICQEHADEMAAMLEKEG